MKRPIRKAGIIQWILFTVVSVANGGGVDSWMFTERIHSSHLLSPPSHNSRSSSSPGRNHLSSMQIQGMEIPVVKESDDHYQEDGDRVSAILISPNTTNTIEGVSISNHHGHEYLQVPLTLEGYLDLVLLYYGFKKLGQNPQIMVSKGSTVVFHGVQFTPKRKLLFTLTKEGVDLSQLPPDDIDEGLVLAGATARIGSLEVVNTYKEQVKVLWTKDGLNLRDVVNKGIPRVFLLPVWENEVLISGVKVKHPDPDKGKLAKEILLSQSGNVRTFGFHEAGINHVNIPAKMVGIVDGIEIDNSESGKELLVSVNENGLNLLELWHNGISWVKLLPGEKVVIDGVEFTNPRNGVFPISVGNSGVVNFLQLTRTGLGSVTIPVAMTAKLLAQWDVYDKITIESFVNKTGNPVKVRLNKSGTIDLTQLTLQYRLLRVKDHTIEIWLSLPSTSTFTSFGGVSRVSRNDISFMATTDTDLLTKQSL